MKYKNEQGSHWNFRVLTSLHTYGNSETERIFEIAEVFYDKDDNPTGHSSGKRLMSTSDLKGLSWQINKIKEGLRKPVLDKDNWPNEFKENGN